MRRSLAAALLGISLWIGALAWSGFVMTNTVLDPDRSEDVAEALLEDEAVRAQLVQNISGGIQAGLPDGAPIDEATIEAGAEQALDSPEVERLFLDAFVGAHRAFLGEGDPPEAIDGGAFGAAARQSVVEQRPELDGLLPETPALTVPLPTERIPDAGPIRRGLLTAVPVLAAIAALGALLALVVTTDRPGVVRRAGFWAIGLSAFVLIIAFGVPALATEIAPAQAEIVAALIGALAASTRGPALALAGAGVMAILVSLLWRSGARTAAAERTAPAPAPAPPRPDGYARLRGGPRGRDLPVPGRRPAPPTHTAPVPSTRVAATPAPPPRSAASPGSDDTRVQPTAGARPTAAASPDPTRHETREGARWVSGVGWVHEGGGPIPDSARWVPGVGYVLRD